VRRVSGLVAADYFAPGYFGWAVLIANFARVGYEEKNMYMAAYDWRLSFQNTEVRERTLSRLKRNIEMMVEINGGEKAVIIPHSMGVRYFLHFMKWVEAPAPMGGGGGSDWGIAPGAIKGNNHANKTCRDVWTEYHEMGLGGIKAITDYKAYTAGDLVDLLEFVAPKMMERGNVHYSHGLADDLDDPKYQHYKYWSNALETKLPNAPDMEIYSMYGMGIPTERAYVYKLTPQTECYIPFQIDNTAGDTNSHVCLKDGVYTVDGDETVPALSAGFMCAKGWRGKTRFNLSGIKTYVREYDHNPPSNLLEGRGTESGAHVDILGNFQLLEDVLRVATGASGEDFGGDRIYTNIFKWSEKINLKL
ncbi:phospholipid:diacylglycerol acyltransferase 1-like protein, partial [Tanacetum coccineum]